MPATDRYASIPAGREGSARSAFEPTPHASAELPYVTRAIYVGGAGDLTVVMADDDAEVTFTGVLAGSLLPIAVKRIDNSTTATNLLALY